MPEPYVGEIRMFAGNFPPAGWMLCQGQTLAISENDVLFQLIGTTYGGDGQETFNLPDLQSRVPIHMGTGADGINYQIGESGGVETVTLTTNQIPNHTHTMIATGNLGSANTPAGNILAQCTGVKMFTSTNPTTPLNASTVLPVGGSQPHENIQPYLVINFIISLFGVFPTQT
jgi:microcystin-dependent protein